jgi:hypothetical protein
LKQESLLSLMFQLRRSSRVILESLTTSKHVVFGASFHQGKVCVCVCACIVCQKRISVC